MNARSTLLLIIFSFIWLSTTGQTHTFKTIKSIIADINQDGKTDTIILSSSLQGRTAYNRISVSISGFPRKIFRAKDEWTAVDKEFLRKNKNTVATNWLFLKKNDKHAVILLFGELDGAGYRGEFSIINIENNNIKMVLDAIDDPDIEIPTGLTDLDNDGRLEFIFREYSQCVQTATNLQVCSYNPFYVYTIADTCKVNNPLMKAYNKKKYVFAGYKYSEDILIYAPEDGRRPRVWHGKLANQY